MTSRHRLPRGVQNPPGTKLAKRFVGRHRGAREHITQLCARWHGFHEFASRGVRVALEHLVSPFSVGLPSLIHPSDPKFKRAQRKGDHHAQSR